MRRGWDTAVDLARAVEALGGPVIAECAMIPAGFAKDVGIGAAGGVVGGAVGVLAGSKEIERRRKDRVTPGDHNGDLYAVLGESRLAFFEVKRSILQRKSLGRLLLQSAISDVANCDFTASRMGASDISLELQDGTTYPLQVARVNRSRGEAFSTALAERLKG
jgi:hypothetical protein